MPRDYNLDTNQHRSNRSILRIIGPLILIAGILLTVIGIGGFFVGFITAFDQGPSFDGPPSSFKLFFLAFIGIPLMGIGGAITKFAFMGAVARYAASEIAPVGKDAANYMIDGTKGAIGDLAQSVGSGIAAGMSGQTAHANTVGCPGCGEACDSGARFCSDCGTPIPGEVRCDRCGAMNEPDAKFCNQCGQSTGV
ncbi:MAG: zinc ribbon domain-containing protein [Phycisphaeraceae bacterium]|nr:zinc ribbon domain-containing protein [Phycisphaeraceae bacterium]